MPLNYPLLVERLNSLFASPPPTVEGCAQLWASAIRDYSLTISPPSTTVAAASQALQPLLVTAFNTIDAQLGMAQAFAAWAGIMGSGMAPAFAGIPPIVPINFSSVFASRSTTHLEAAQKFALIIHSWVLTGTATNTVSGASVNWI
jgi:hypothetical protein